MSTGYLLNSQLEPACVMFKRSISILKINQYEEKKLILLNKNSCVISLASFNLL